MPGFAADAYARIHGLGCICVTYCVGGPEPVQQHRRGLCREVAGDRAGGLAGDVGAGAQPALAPQGQGVRDAVRGVSRRSRSPRPCSTTRDGVQRDRPGARGGGPVQAAGLPRAAPRPGAWRGRSGRTGRRRACRPATPTRSARRSTRRRRCSRRPSGRSSWPTSRSTASASRTSCSRLAESTGMPIATTILGKSVISEAHPLFAGVYEGAMGRARGHRAGRVGRLPADARLLPDRHQPGDLHGQARPVAVHRRDQRRPADQAPPLSATSGSTTSSAG